MRTTERRRRGLSLLEMLITMAIIAFVATAAFGILLAGKRAWQANVGRTEVRQALQVASWRIDTDLRNTGAGYVTNNTASTPAAFSFPSALDSRGRFTTEADGVPDWQTFVIYYVPAGTTRLLRREAAAIPVDPDVDPALTAAQLTGYCDGTGRLVASGVRTFSLAVDTDKATAVLTLVLEARNQNGGTERQARTSTIFMRN